MVGSGVFTTSGFLLSDLGSPALVLAVWGIAGVLALAGATAYAELGTLLPRAGGEYVYLSAAYHPAVGFSSGFVSLVAGFAAPIAAASLAFGRYAATLWPGTSPRLCAALLILAATLLHASGTRRGGRAQLALTALNLTLVLGFVLLALGAPGASPGRLVQISAAPPAAFAVALIYASYSYLGWNAAAYVAGELREPRRSLPIALLAGCGAVTLLYVLLNAAFLASAPTSTLAGRVEVAHTAAEALWGGSAARLVSALVCVALAGHVSALIMTGPRVYAAMAEDGLLWPAFARRGRGGAPFVSVIVQGALALVAVLSATFEALLLYIGLLLGLSTILAVAAVFVLRRRLPHGAAFRTRLHPWAPLAYLGLSIWMTVHAAVARPRESLAGLLTLVAGLAAYSLRRRAPRA
jgi:APA family basic amino acid/polyamine antiporter